LALCNSANGRALNGSRVKVIGMDDVSGLVPDTDAKDILRMHLEIQGGGSRRVLRVMATNLKEDHLAGMVAAATGSRDNGCVPPPSAPPRPPRHLPTHHTRKHTHTRSQLSNSDVSRYMRESLHIQPEGDGERLDIRARVALVKMWLSTGASSSGVRCCDVTVGGKVSYG
jgi:hypothetical protein